MPEVFAVLNTGDSLCMSIALASYVYDCLNCMFWKNGFLIYDECRTKAPI